MDNRENAQKDMGKSGEPDHYNSTHIAKSILEDVLEQYQDQIVGAEKCQKQAHDDLSQKQGNAAREETAVPESTKSQWSLVKVSKESSEIEKKDLAISTNCLSLSKEYKEYWAKDDWKMWLLNLSQKPKDNEVAMPTLEVANVRELNETKCKEVICDAKNAVEKMKVECKLTKDVQELDAKTETRQIENIETVTTNTAEKANVAPESAHEATDKQAHGRIQPNIMEKVKIFEKFAADSDKHIANQMIKRKVKFSDPLEEVITYKYNKNEEQEDIIQLTKSLTSETNANDANSKMNLMKNRIMQIITDRKQMPTKEPLGKEEPDMEIKMQDSKTGAEFLLQRKMRRAIRKQVIQQQSYMSEQNLSLELTTGYAEAASHALARSKSEQDLLQQAATETIAALSDFPKHTEQQLQDAAAKSDATAINMEDFQPLPAVYQPTVTSIDDGFATRASTATKPSFTQFCSQMACRMSLLNLLGNRNNSSSHNTLTSTTKIFQADVSGPNFSGNCVLPLQNVGNMDNIATDKLDASAVEHNALEMVTTTAPTEPCKIAVPVGPPCGIVSTFVEEAEAAAIEDSTSNRSTESIVCRICHNAENPQTLVSPCLCRGSLSYVHISCLERWICLSRSTSCELCKFRYNTEQTLRYSLFRSLSLWYSRPLSRQALQEDCQMFSLLTLVAFAIIGTLLVGIQYYMQARTTAWGRIWTKGWLIFFLLSTIVVYLLNTYILIRSQLLPWYNWWQSARNIRLVLENRRPLSADVLQSMASANADRNASNETAKATPLANTTPLANANNLMPEDAAATNAQHANGAQARPENRSRLQCLQSKLQQNARQAYNSVINAKQKAFGKKQTAPNVPNTLITNNTNASNAQPTAAAAAPSTNSVDINSTAESAQVPTRSSSVFDAVLEAQYDWFMAQAEKRIEASSATEESASKQALQETVTEVKAYATAIKIPSEGDAKFAKVTPKASNKNAREQSNSEEWNNTVYASSAAADNEFDAAMQIIQAELSLRGPITTTTAASLVETSNISQYIAQNPMPQHLNTQIESAEGALSTESSSSDNSVVICMPPDE